MIKLYFSSWRKTFQFRGRATRREFWLFTIINYLLLLASGYLWHSLTSLKFTFWYLSILWRNLAAWLLLKYVATNIIYLTLAFMLIYFSFALLLLVASWSLSVRRLHDIGKSGYSLFWWAVPVAGWLIILRMHFKKGTPAANIYGATPENSYIISARNNLPS